MRADGRRWLLLQAAAAVLAVSTAVLAAVVIAEALEPDATGGGMSGVATALVIVSILLVLALAPLALKWQRGKRVLDRKGMTRAVIADPDPDL